MKECHILCGELETGLLDHVVNKKSLDSVYTLETKKVVYIQEMLNHVSRWTNMNIFKRLDPIKESCQQSTNVLYGQHEYTYDINKKKIQELAE